MRIRSVRVQNFRAFEDETVSFDSCTCLVGSNGAGKSTILGALNVFFQEAGSATDVATLTAEDFHGGNTDIPVQITVTFDQLSDAAKEDLSHYVRHGELVVTSIAVFDAKTAKAPVIQWGERLVFKQFAAFFEDDKNKATVEPLRARFFEVTKGLADFPDIGKKPTKAAMIEALRSYEEARPEICESQRSTDHFYGVGRARGRLEPYVQWVYLPAVKDASAEAEEAGNTAWVNCSNGLSGRRLTSTMHWRLCVHVLVQSTTRSFRRSRAHFKKSQTAWRNVSLSSPTPTRA
ncbi:AAA family ATPase [Bradyrhizobium yuanmingense]|uniref:AAA family ATPase n=1 Tax=Bradyrhizobium yuanmingense TaxID=108015 RepID=UPI0030B8C0DC|nr:AAA family ATPase [Bradyrhizobium yuanmingense]